MSLHCPTRSIQLLEFGSSQGMRKQPFLPHETSSVAKSMEKRLFSQAIRLMKSSTFGLGLTAQALRSVKLATRLFILKKPVITLHCSSKWKCWKLSSESASAEYSYGLKKKKKKKHNSIKQSRFCWGNGEFKMPRWRRQRELQKTNTFNKQNNNFARTSRFFCTFLSRRYTTTTWKCLISRFVEDGNTKQHLIVSFAFLEIW